MRNADPSRPTRMSWLLLAALSALALRAWAADSPGPRLIMPPTALPPPRDIAYPGQITLSVDASDLTRRDIHVHEVLTGITPATVLLYPQWLPGDHAPEGTLDRLAGIRISSGGQPVSWTREPGNIWAFQLHPGRGATQVDIEFDYLSPVDDSVGDTEISRTLLAMPMNEYVLYPAGYFTRRIPIEATVKLPDGWKYATALEPAKTDGASVTFKATTLNTFVDSPLYAGRYVARFDLDPKGGVPVHLNLFADRAALLQHADDHVAPYQSLVQQAYRLFGSHHYAHYDFLYLLSDQVNQAGLEHHQSSEDGGEPNSFSEWDRADYDRDLLPHEYTHSWNGKFRRPADLWTPDFNVPMQDSLLWVYEGQTEYWGKVLAARSGLWSRQQALDDLAAIAAWYDHESGRAWRSVQDTTNDEIINPRRPISWRDFQRFEDYYDEGALIWLDVDTLIRQRSQGKRSLDDFARAFFGINDGSLVTVTYTFDDVVKALNAVEPYDWAGFLRQRLDATQASSPLDGLKRGGYTLTYTDTPSALTKSTDDERSMVDLRYSIGIQIDDKDHPGSLHSVQWDSPAAQAGLTKGGQIIAVNGHTYSGDLLIEAISEAKGSRTPIELIVRLGDDYRIVRLDYHDGLRYPHLERDASVPALLDDILSPRS